MHLLSNLTLRLFGHVLPHRHRYRHLHRSLCQQCQEGTFYLSI